MKVIMKKMKAIVRTLRSMFCEECRIWRFTFQFPKVCPQEPARVVISGISPRECVHAPCEPAGAGRKGSVSI